LLGSPTTVGEAAIKQYKPALKPPEQPSTVQAKQRGSIPRQGKIFNGSRRDTEDCNLHSRDASSHFETQHEQNQAKQSSKSRARAELLSTNSTKQSKAYAGRGGVLRSHKSPTRAAEGALAPSMNRTRANRVAN